MNRRSFLKSSGLLIGGLYLSGKAFAVVSPQDSGKLIKGRIRARRKNIANAIVSDGYNVAVSDRRGRYTLQLHHNAKHIFLSNPSGYNIKNVHGFAAIYRLPDSGAYNFELEKTTYNDHHHYFLALGDPQIRDKEDVRQLRQESLPDIAQFLASMPKEKFHGISLGDSIWDTPKLWQDYKETIGKVGIPFFQTIGNHDKQEVTANESDDAALFKAHFGPSYYSFNRGKVHYVVLDTIRYTRIKQYDGHISAEQLSWLKKDLQHVPKDHVLIISVHIPIYNSVKNRDELYALFEDFQQIHVLSGHTHRNTNHVNGNIYEHTHATLCGAWWTGPVCTDGTPRGYGVFEVDGTSVNWFYKSIGKDRNYQFRSSVQKLSGGMNRIMVNVWNYDPAWKVIWFADGVAKGDLEQTKGFDELAVSLYKGKERPKERRAWVEPGRTDHLFYTQTDAKTVKIVVTDRFGNEYTEDIQLA
ncbi:metallophosphoesterase [Sphingobacterium phlebotomi]|uniref:Metallophosphoesterase n=1 Tax=Sphingobacterium phlebotomi TaxID=2605433 RepID=A0A5D4HBE1_9SPHI|nr:calcineurin-like phosphoesterase family protein [Sphingobacterium phlebotomi]TYR37968.1 metallophosphoesterase [Sphingobacterium phlebotomi]